MSMLLVPILYKRTQKQLKRDGDDGSGKVLNRESRLFFAMIGAPALPIGLFWMAWTDFVSITSAMRTRFSHCLIIYITVLHFNLVSFDCLCRHRICQHLHLHVRLHVCN